MGEVLLICQFRYPPNLREFSAQLVEFSLLRDLDIFMLVHFCLASISIIFSQIALIASSFYLHSLQLFPVILCHYLNFKVYLFCTLLILFFFYFCSRISLIFNSFCWLCNLFISFFFIILCLCSYVLNPYSH